MSVDRSSHIRTLKNGDPFDLLVIGGGATGAGIALDAASRNYRVALVEREDFGSGTSSKSSKLVHGGVRYLANAEFSLVREALRERSRLRKNAPHLVKPLGFVIPARGFYERLKYTVGLKLYDLLAGDSLFARSRSLKLAELATMMRGLNQAAFSSAVIYSDAQFDDTRLLWDIVAKAESLGATIANYCEVTGLTKEHSKLSAVRVMDRESQQHFEISARSVINATGAWSDYIGALDNEDDDKSVVPSQGTHIVIDRHFFPSDQALLIPRTADGRVMFVIPWHDKVVIGTTDEKLPSGSTEPMPTSEEIDLVLSTAADYLTTPPTRKDVTACFAGIRPLAAVGGKSRTAKISREHSIEVSDSGLITINGGKWTTYRLMAEQCVDMFEQVSNTAHRPCVTNSLAISSDSNAGPFCHYGDKATELEAMITTDPALGEPLTPELTLTAAHVAWAVRHEMARTLMDVLARRTRSVFLNARATQAVAPRVAEIMCAELGENDNWISEQLQVFERQLSAYLLP
ncbi:MAG: glycerol-3-phosphate dehydrogenase/oxidase [Pseudomonadota bacterium]